MTEEDKQINHLVGRLHSIEFEFSSLDGEHFMEYGWYKQRMREEIQSFLSDYTKLNLTVTLKRDDDIPDYVKVFHEELKKLEDSVRGIVNNHDKIKKWVEREQKQCDRMADVYDAVPY